VAEPPVVPPSPRPPEEPPLLPFEEPSALPRRRSPWRFRIGLTLLVGGFSLLAYVAWQLYGTNYVSQQRHDDTVEALREEWARPGGTASVRTADSLAGAIVRVPAFGDDYAVPLVEGISDEALSSGFGLFPQSAAPGAVGNVAIAGHRITHGEPLRAMPELQPGDEIVIETRERIHTYVLDTGGDDLRVPFTAGWVVATEPVNPDGGVGPADEPRLITVTTCAELFHTDDRLVAFGHLVESLPR
jgi:sortase A